MGVAGAAGAMLGLEGCIRRPEEKILPFTKQPEYVVPGVALHYATVVRTAGEPLGLLVTSHEGRPTKIEGNPQHPSSLGGTDGYTQAAILDLYDPDRSPAPATRKCRGPRRTSRSRTSTRPSTGLAKAADANKGAKLRVLLQPSQSPTVLRAEQALLARFPQAKIYSYEPVGPANRQALRPRSRSGPPPTWCTATAAPAPSSRSTPTSWAPRPAHRAPPASSPRVAASAPRSTA